MLIVLQTCVDLENANSGHSGSLSSPFTGDNMLYYNTKTDILKGKEALWDKWFQRKWVWIFFLESELPYESCRPKIRSSSFPQRQATTRQHMKQKRKIVEDMRDFMQRTDLQAKDGSD